MRESSMIALVYLKAKASKFGIDPRLFDHWDIHIHIPAGAIPKDGPSAGVNMLTALASAFTQRKVQPHLAMTGEITLRSQVLPVGGNQEKILAARRADSQKLIHGKNKKQELDEYKQE